MNREKKGDVRVAVIGVLLAGAACAIYFCHVTLKCGIVFTHFFYIPIVLSSVWWKRKGMIVPLVLVVSLMLSSVFLLPEDAPNSIIRSSMFLLVGFVVAVLSERVERTAGKLRESGERLRTILEGIPVATFVIDQDHRIMHWNRAMEKMSGIRGDAVKGTKNHWKIFYENERPCVSDLLLDEMMEKIPVLYGNKCEKSQLLDGAYVGTDYFPMRGGKWLRFTAAVIRDSSGCLVGAVEAFEDITEKMRADDRLREYREHLEDLVKNRTKDLTESNNKLRLEISERTRAEEALRKSEVRYRTILESIQDGYYEFDLAGNFIFFNDSMCKILGYSRDEMMGMNNRMYMDERNAKRVFKEFNRVYTSGDVSIGYDSEIINKAGDVRYVEIYVSSMKDENGSAIGFRGTFRDVTDRKRAEEAYQKVKVAEEASKTKTQFLANVSHEIRTPMNGIIGFVELTMDTTLTPQQQEYLQIIQTSAYSLLRIIEDILDISKIEAGRLELDASYFDLRKTLKNVHNTLSFKAREKGLELNWRLEPETPAVLEGDDGRLRQIILNLGGNAVKFTEKGKVALTCEVAEKDDESALLHFYVSDTGIGIPEDKMKIIFERFSQAEGDFSRKYGGTGLGLAISKQLCEMMGGGIWVESELGRGSTFHFTARFGLPSEEDLLLSRSMSGGFADRNFNHNSIEREEQADKLKILVAEDDFANRILSVRVLERCGYSAVAVSNGKEVISELESQEFDLVLMDIRMPEMDGIMTTHKIRNSASSKFDPRIPIIALTAHAMEGDRERFLEEGMNDYISKPLNEEDLLRVIEGVGWGKKETASVGESAPRSVNYAPVRMGLQSISGGDRDQLQENPITFLNETPGKMEALKEALERMDFDLMERQAHIVKVAAAGIGAARMKGYAFRMELASRKEDLNEVQRLYVGLRKEFESIQEKLSDKDCRDRESKNE